MKRLTRDLSRWDVYLYREARMLPPASDLDGPRRQFEDELFCKLYGGETSDLVAPQRSRDHAEWAERVHAQLAQLPQFERLRSQCHGDALAAAEAVDTLMAGVQPEEQRAPEHLERRDLRSACVRASKNVDDLREDLAALEHVTAGQPGTGTKHSGTPTTASAFELAQQLRARPRLRELARLAGRVRQVAAAWRRKRVRHTPEEITSIEAGNDLGRLLPSELVQLAHPLLRLVALRNLLESTAMQYGLTGADQQGRGPMVVCLDKSGSMEGERDRWATAVALALLDAAKSDGRTCAIIGFDGAIKREDQVPPGGALPLEALFTGCDGGTNIDAAIDRALQVIETDTMLRQADIVLITDGVSNSNQAPVLRQRASARGVEIFGIGIGVSASDLAPWCTAATTVTDLASLDAGTANLLFAA